MNKYEVIFDMLKGQYAFNKDLEKNKTHELWACNQITNNGLAKTANLVDSTDKVLRKSRDAMLTEPDHLVEIKKDIRCYSTGNLFFEIMARNEPSAIMTTKADWWFQSYYCFDGKVRTGIAETTAVKKLINSGKYKLLSGGDKYKGGKAAEGIIVPWKDYHSICMHTFEIDAEEYIKQIGLENELNRRLQTTKQNSAW